MESGRNHQQDTGKIHMRNELLHKKVEVIYFSERRKGEIVPLRVC